MRFAQTVGLVAALATGLMGASVAYAAEIKAAVPKTVDIQEMTWPELKAALAAGKTTALFYTGGTEQRGPQNIIAGHNYIGREMSKHIAEKLGNAIAMPVLPYTPNAASADLPGTIGLTPEILALVLDRIAAEAITNGFKNVVLMGDHGGGQPNVYRTVAQKLDAEYAARGIHVYYCDQVYAPANAVFDKMLTEKKLPISTHAGISDTSEMMYLSQDTPELWVRKALIATAVGDPVPVRGQPAPPSVAKNGITGDARASSVEFGKVIFDLRVDHAVRQIQSFIKK